MNQQISKFIESGNKGRSEVLSNTLGTAKEIAALIKFSPKCESIIWEVKDIIDSEIRKDLCDCRKDGLLILCPTRWTEEVLVKNHYY